MIPERFDLRMPEVQRIVLEKIRFAAIHRFSELQLHPQTVEAELIHDVANRGFVMCLSAEFLGREVRRTTEATEQVPDRPRDALLLMLAERCDRRLPGLAASLRRRARTRAVATVVREVHICPHINVKFPDTPYPHLEFLKDLPG